MTEEIYQQKQEQRDPAIDLSRSVALILDEVSIRDTSSRLDLPTKETESLTKFYKTKTSNSEQLLKVLADCLLKSKVEPKRRLLRLLSDKVLLQVLNQHIYTSTDLKSVISLIGVLLQSTDDFNLTTLAYLTREEIRSQIPKILTQITVDFMKAIVRCINAQPVLCDVWDLSALVSVDSTLLEGEISLLVQHLKIILGHPNQSNQNASDRVQLVDSLLINKIEEARCKQLIGHLKEEEEEEQGYDIDSDELVCTDYLYRKANQIIKEMERKPFGNFSLSGPSGSGKMSLVQIVNKLYFKKHKTLNGTIVITLESTFDSKNLVGTYVCNETGEFQFKKGPLTIAAENGMWLILRNIEDTPPDLLSFLLPIIQENVLQVTSTLTIKPKLGFRIFVLSKGSTQFLDERVSYQQDDIQPLISLMYKEKVDGLICNDQPREDFQQILKRRFPSLFIELSSGFNVNSLLKNSIEYISQHMAQMRPYLLDFRPCTVNQLLQVYARVSTHFQHLSTSEANQVSQAQRYLIIEELCDVYLGYLYDSPIRQKLIQALVQTQFNTFFEGVIDGEQVSEYCTKMGREFGISTQSCFFGRITMNKINEETSQTNFVYTGATVRLLEQISASIKMNEPVLLVGETGTGKTTAVQEIAKVVGKKLHVFNMNQNTDSADLMGGFKPVDLKYLLKPIYEHFLYVFSEMFQKTKNNTKFLDVTQKCYQANRVKEFLQCIQHGLVSMKGKQDAKFLTDLAKLESQLKDLQKRTKKLESTGGFVFQFVEGTLIKSLQNGDWVLLDEINLASESVLNRLATVIQGNHVLLNERADVIDLKVHSDFRLFMCMNPPYSSAGKKQLPQSLRSKISEIYVPELDNESDLWSIIDRYTRQNQHTTLNEEQKRQILQFYIQVKTLVSKQTKRGNIGLRNLCRALRFINAAMNLKYPPLKAIYDSLFTCFASHLDSQLQELVKQQILILFKIRSLPKLAIAGRQKDERFAYIEDSLVILGNHKPENFNANNFILTQSFRTLVQQLASVISVSDFAVILEGPTSAGKTSCITYLAAVTHNHVIRINNHMHTDVQEYIGSYIPDAETGKLAFQEGILVEAVRKGYWVILDELNLAPSEVLEALNRLLDDNRELHIVETQKVIKAHPSFRIFATQNPTEGYGGRKELSEAFKNRFVMIKVRDVPTDELKQILEQKCSLPASRASLMVKVMDNLQIYRSQSSVFSGKESTITVRDLLKWAGRVNLNSSTDMHMDQYFIALEGFLVLGERSRDPKDKMYIKETIEKVFGVILNIEEFYEKFFDKNLATVFANIPKELNLPPIILSKQLKRLATLVYKCILNKEPVLMVGETGSGKTTLCQVIAHSVTKQQLFAINCHQNTETSDFIGCMRTRKNLSQVQDNLTKLLDNTPLTEEQQSSSKQLSLKKRAKFIFGITQKQEIEQMLDDLSCVFEWTDGILVNAMQEGGLLLIDEISLANDSVLERLNSVFEYDRTLVISEKSSVEAIRIVAQDKFNMVATMNPGSDFGKKELSPALRNRMTEIWVESYFHQAELVKLVKSQVGSVIPSTDLLQDIDLHLIIKELCKAELPSTFVEPVTQGIFSLICFVNFTLAAKYFSMQRKSLSIRDIINLVHFIRINSTTNAMLTNQLELSAVFEHAVQLVIIDGLCLGIDVTNQQEQANITRDCNKCLDLVLSQVFGSTQIEERNEVFIDTVSHIGVTPFLIERQIQKQVSTFAFQAETTKRNLMKLLRAFTLGKPVLIEGPPGVGKTSLVENLAKQTGKTLIRVNLSEQTDMMDLLGSEYPTASAEEDEIKFSWCDGVLLQAIKMGYWFLIDEMNLAQQSILEGLNAILDHRRTVYIPELNQEFVCHPDFFVFACQNPSQSAGQTSGRKTLPKSFLNRFAKIYLDDLTQKDYKIILSHQANDLFTDEKVDLLLDVTQQINKIQLQSENSAKVNMRDLSRFLILHRHFLRSQNLDTLTSVATSFKICYKDINLAFKNGFIDQINLPKTSLLRIKSHQVSFQGLHKTILKNQSTSVAKQYRSRQEFSFCDYQALKGEHAEELHQLCDALQANLPVLIVTNDPMKLQKSLAVISHLHSAQLKRILLNERSDTTQLLGCFEQTSNDIGQILSSILSHKHNIPLPVAQQIYKLEHDMCWSNSIDHQFSLVSDFLHQHPTTFTDARTHLSQLKQSASKFEWVDSVLVQSVKEGHWAVFENANLCNPSILDRLNGLFEDGNQALSVNEQGLVEGQLREVSKHKDFRAIFVITQHSVQDLGKDVSKALRNRCLEIKVNFKTSQVREFNILDEKQICAQPMTLIDQLFQTQNQHDRIPISALKEDLIQSPVIITGKRQNPEISKLEVPSLQKASICDFKNEVIKSYKYYLAQLDVRSGSEPFMQHLEAEIQEMQKSLKLKLESQVIDRQLQKYLMALVESDSQPTQLLHIFLTSLLAHKTLRDIVIDPLIIYQSNQINTTVKLQTNQELSFVQDSQNIDFVLLKGIIGPDYQLIEKTKNYQTMMPTCEVFVYKLPLQYMLTKNQESRFSTIVRQFKFSSATVILIDNEKEIVLEHDKIVKHLEDTCFDMGTVLEMPNLVIIPASVTEGVVVMSQSYIYESLCFIKDLIKLQSGKCTQITHMRLSRIPQVVKNTSNEEISIVLRQLTMLNLQRSYSDKSFQLNLIKAVVSDEQSISLKDLPAAYACTHSLLYKLQQLDQYKQSESTQQQMFNRLIETRLDYGFDTDVQQALQNRWEQTEWPDEHKKEKAREAMTYLARAFYHLQQLKTVEIIRAMFVLPLEVKRRNSLIELSKQEIEAERFFWQYHYRETVQSEYLLQPKIENLTRLEVEVVQLVELAPQSLAGPSDKRNSENIQRDLRMTLQFVKILGEELVKVRTMILEQKQVIATEPLSNLVFKQLDTIQFASVSNLLSELIVGVATVLTQFKTIASCEANASQLTNTAIGLQSDKNVLVSMFVDMKNQETPLQELSMKFLLKQGRFSLKNNFKLDSAILEYFIQREVIKRMQLEEKNQELFQLPFRMREQTIPEPLGKAMDEWTDKDKAKMEAEAAAQIELNFPSYFDDVQKAYFAGEFQRDQKVDIDLVPQEVEVEDILSEMLELSISTEQIYRQNYLRDRLAIVHQVLEQQKNLDDLDYNEWIDDVSCYLSNSLHEQKLKQVMNISDVRLASSYNFYHSSLPAECKLVYQPLIQLQMRLRDITIRDQYESPLLNEAIFLSNYMLTCFNIEITPLMKVLTSIEFLLTKLEDWENTYASKRLNSVETEINQFKLLVIRYRKIQILSWRNLLNWKLDALIREDFPNCVRLAHTITKQVFEGTEEVIKILDLLDLYIRDSTLGTFRPRLKFLSVLKEHLLNKQSNIVRVSDTVALRLQQAINCLTFVIAYYTQFKPKLQQTIDRLDIAARDKVKTLIDVSKWTLQKFSIMKNNVDRTHRQLNKACKVEEEVLIQNVQSLVLLSSRKKFIGSQDQLLELDYEGKVQIYPKSPRECAEQTSVTKQVSFLENTKIWPMWPSCMTVQNAIAGFMERLQDVRALNKKYLQKKAFYDLLKFMKDEGLRSNFQTAFQPLLIQCNKQSTYFMKAYETFILLKSSSQSEDNADLKNIDVLRVQCFSQHLMHTTLEITLKVQSLEAELITLDFIPAQPQTSVSIEGPLPQFKLQKSTKVPQLLSKFRALLESFVSKSALLIQLTHDTDKKDEIRAASNQASDIWMSLPTQVQDVNACNQVIIAMEKVRVLLQLNGTHSNRVKRVFQETVTKIIAIQQLIVANVVETDVEIEVSTQQIKLQKVLENRVKLFYQDVLKKVDTIQSSIVINSAPISADGISTTEVGESNNLDVRMIDNMPELTMEERLKFLEEIKKTLTSHLPRIQSIGKKILNEIADIHTATTLLPAVSLLRKVQIFVRHLCAIENTYLDSVSKFAYLTQRVFLYLIYQGFCGQEESDDPDVEPPSDLEAEGMGMGDGKTGENNITDQIEHEEQLEGLKDYESNDEKKPEEEKSEKGDNNEEDGNDFEMKEDFDGEMDEEQKSQNSKKDDDDQDDELDEVDDMLDNQLWNQNMEDMEEQEEKEQKEEKREQDLGERELQDQNMIDQDSQMAEGDHEEREAGDDKQKSDKKEDAEMAEASDDENAERDPDDDKEDQEIGLDNESVPAEPEDSFAEESKSEEGHDMSDNADSQKGDDDSINSQFEEQMEGQEDISSAGSEEEEQSLNVKNDFNQAVLEDDQIQANEHNKDKNDQANLKKQQENKVESSNNNKQQEKLPDNVDSQQVDPNGDDLLFQFAQKLQQREQNKKQQTKDKKQSKQDAAEKKPQQVEDPTMLDKDKQVPDYQKPEIQQDQIADEYMFDEQAQQTEGKLAADQVQDNAHQEENEDAPMKDEESKEVLPENLPEEVEMTNQVALNQKQAKNLNQSKAVDKQDDKALLHDEDLEIAENQQDLINEYNSYLKKKQTPLDLTQIEPAQQQQQPGMKIAKSLEHFDYFKQKEFIRQMFQDWQEDLEAHEVSVELLAKFKNQTSQVSASLCEQLRIVLEPQLSQNLQGDFKTGKRLNMKKVISFIASNYRNDKIWLRRTLPSKRDYKILIAIDDSLSMKESNLGFFSLEASVALSEALNRLEVGKVAVARIRDRLELVHSFEDQYSSERAAHIISQFEFKHCASTSADTSMSNFVSDANKLLDMQNNNSSSVSCPFVIVLSDGRFNKDNVKRYMREAKEKRYLYIFVILDQTGTRKEQSIMSMRSAVKQQNGGIKLEAYLKDFPFDYYCVVQDISQLPSALGTILVQWFSLVSTSS